MIVIQNIGFHLKESTSQEIKKKLRLDEKCLPSGTDIFVKIFKQKGVYYTAIAIKHRSKYLFASAHNEKIIVSINIAVSKFHQQLQAAKSKEKHHRYNQNNCFCPDIENTPPPGARLCYQPHCICVNKYI